MTVTNILVFVLAGALSGGLAGLLGLGGGIFIVPFLMYELPQLGIQNNNLMQLAVGTSLAIIVFTSLSSAYGHYRRGAIFWPLIRGMLLGVVLGAITGAVIARYLPGDVLRVIFGLFVILVAYRIAFPLQEIHAHVTPKKLRLLFSGFTIANFCTLLGIGGGSLMVPYFLKCNVPLRNAVGTSAAMAFPLALTAVMVLMLASDFQNTQIPSSLGYVYIPAFLAMVLPSMVFAPLGAKLTSVLPVMVLRRIFAVFLLLVSVDMLSKTFTYLWHLL